MKIISIASTAMPGYSWHIQRVRYARDVTWWNFGSIQERLSSFVFTHEKSCWCSSTRNESAADESRERRKWWRHTQFVFGIRSAAKGPYWSLAIRDHDIWNCFCIRETTSIDPGTFNNSLLFMYSRRTHIGTILWPSREPEWSELFSSADPSNFMRLS
jgi:hypothetical protein